MAGHNKWTQIKRQKGASDAKRSQLFGKLSKLISTQVKLARGDRTAPGVINAIDKARAVNMPKDTIDRAIAKATEQKDLESIIYEAYGPGGVGIIIEALTDNRNKAAQEIKFILSKNNATLASIGAVRWAFIRENSDWVATQTVELSDSDLELLGNLVDELEANDEVQEVITNAL